jgi:Ca2+:H+ antiporter
MSVTEETSISEAASGRKRKNKIPIAVWFLVLTPVVIVYSSINPTAHTLLFALSVAAIIPLAMVLSQSTESVAAKTGDMVGGLLNATLGNLTELIIALAALKAGEFVLVKASLAGALITNTLFMLGASFLFGGLKHHVQDFNKAGARLQSAMMFLASVALLVPSLIAIADTSGKPAFVQDLSMAIAIILLVTYALGLVFSLKTHKTFFAAAGGGHEGHEESLWPLAIALPVLAIVTVGIAFVSEIFVESVQVASEDLGMSPAFVGFIVVALVGAAAEMATAFSAARKDRLDLSVSIGMGSASQIALFVSPVLILLSYVIAPTPMDMVFWPGAVLMVMIATLTGTLVTSSGRSAWFVGVLMIAVYLVFASTLFLIPPKVG